MADFFEELGDRVGINRPRNNIADLGRGSKNALGSAGYYATPLPSLLDDQRNREANEQQAQADEAQARDREQQSIGQLDSLRRNQINFADTLKKNAERDESGLLETVAKSERQSLAESLKRAKENAASRGLLGSGFQKSNEANAKAQSAATVASKQNQIHQMTQAQIKDAQDLAVQLGLEMGGLQQNLSDQYYRMAIDNMNQRNAALGSLLQTGGQAAGMYYAKQNNPNSTGYVEDYSPVDVYSGPYGG